MSKIRLGVNIDHVATVRNARGENYPSPLRAAIAAQKCGAHSVTIHLREDRRHINDFDLLQIKSKLKIFQTRFFCFSSFYSYCPANIFLNGKESQNYNYALALRRTFVSFGTLFDGSSQPFIQVSLS